jgi:hypothetical protein
MSSRAPVSARPLGLAMALAGVAMAVLAFLPWYSARVPSGRASASGVDASGEIWSLPALGALAVAAGLVLAAAGSAPGSPLARRAGLTALVAGALGVFWAIKNGLDVPVAVVMSRAPGAVDLGVPVDVEPAAFGAAAAAACASLAGLLAMRSDVRS